MDPGPRTVPSGDECARRLRRRRRPGRIGQAGRLGRRRGCHGRHARAPLSRRTVRATPWWNSCRATSTNWASLFLFEKLTAEQLTWLCEHGGVERWDPGMVYREGDPATCFFVMLEGEIALLRRVGGDDIEVSRTDHRGVYAGAWGAYLGDRVPQTYAQSMRAVDPVPVLRAGRRGFRAADERLVPDGGAPARGPVLRQPEGRRARSLNASDCSPSARCPPGSPTSSTTRPPPRCGRRPRCGSGSPGCATSWP